MNTEWCWAASITMIANYYGRGLAQCNVLSAYLSADCCLFPSACDVGAPSMQTIQQGLNLLAGLQSTYVFGAIPLDAVRTEIANGRPIIVGYRGSFGGHVVVINGYDAASNVSILDPFYGTFIVPYGQTFTYNGQFVWSDTIVGIH